MIGADVVFKQWISCSSSIGGGSGVVTPTAMPKPSLEPKCSHSHDETRIAANNSNTKNALLTLALIGDVLAVNLLRLLATFTRGCGCHSAAPSPAAACFISFLLFQFEYMLHRVNSMAATEVLTEIQSITDPTRELMLPLDVEDEAVFYYNDKL
mmetsp:Transcript_11945/g.20968  ORF Transcript_11945/g.20968 Transcript_11945/m.20968 type:complete len:154 (+) Transcript_11945:284-745(+)